MGSRRPSAIAPTLALQLRRYLRFRALFRYPYDDDLDWNRPRPLIERMNGLLIEFKTGMALFISQVQKK